MTYTIAQGLVALRRMRLDHKCIVRGKAIVEDRQKLFADFQGFTPGGKIRQSERRNTLPGRDVQSPAYLFPLAGIPAHPLPFSEDAARRLHDFFRDPDLKEPLPLKVRPDEEVVDREEILIHESLLEHHLIHLFHGDNRNRAERRLGDQEERGDSRLRREKDDRPDTFESIGRQTVPAEPEGIR